MEPDTSREPNASRACDACYRRKVRCSGYPHCRHCRATGLLCLLERPISRRGPKRRTFASYSEGLCVSGNEGLLPIDIEAFRDANLAVQSIETTLELGWKGDTFLRSIVSIEAIRDAITQCKYDETSQRMIVSIALHILTQKEDVFRVPLQHCDVLCDHKWWRHLQKCVQNLRCIRIDPNFALQRNRECALISFLISCFYERLLEPGVSWYYLQEAITFSYTDTTDGDGQISGLGLWLAITERIRAIKDHKSICMDKTSTTSQIMGDISLLYKLLEPFDNHFLTIWNSPASIPSFEYMISLQQHIMAVESSTCLLMVARCWLSSILLCLSLRLETASATFLLDYDMNVTYLITSFDLALSAKSQEMLMALMIQDIYRQYQMLVDLGYPLDHQRDNINVLKKAVEEHSSKSERL